eukprot:CAMPEP_0196664542 /NCGR_PEP_ID=MMETSP1086-20130531/57582_1 /TAXON_ID=77921 /ORGANISM="Cyanoptyche  gloeocystis , Strain SAG4.97" /LENGTH=164 /DNA_ID=CAMNT_0042000913 /DNA_START=24 /DNA_END=518 /DNA_ORIENTATION=-
MLPALRSVSTSFFGRGAFVQSGRCVPKRLILRSYASAIKYSKDHEWVRTEADSTATVGITDFAQNQLGDIVFVDLPDVGSSIEKGATFGAVESVKAASEVYAPVSGEVVGVNKAIKDDPSIVNQSPLDKGWFIKLKLAPSAKGQLEELLDEAAYKKHCDESAKH